MGRRLYYNNDSGKVHGNKGEKTVLTVGAT